MFSFNKEKIMPFMVILMFFWALMHPISKMFISDITPSMMAFLRNFLGVITLFALLYARKKSIAVERSDLVGIYFFGIVGTALSSLLLFMGMNLSTATNASILVNTNPILIAVIAPFLISERITKKQLFGVVLAFLGIILVTTNGMPFGEMLKNDYFFGNLLLIGASVCITLYTIFCKGYLKKYDGMVVTFHAVLAGSVFLLFYLAASNGFYAISGISTGGWLAALYVGIIVTGIIYWLWYQSMQSIGATRASAFKLLIPVFATAASIFLLSEALTVYLLMGGILVLAGIALSQRTIE